MNDAVPDTHTSPQARQLSHLRVLDFTWGGAGPLLTKTLADFGADVVKVESTTNLDFPRTLPPYADKKAGINRSAYFTNRNSSKRSIILDLREPADRETALSLARCADVVAANFRAGVMENLGLGYADISRINPEVIYLTMPMTPSSGPTAGYRGVGRTITGMTGIHALTGYEDGHVVGPGTHFPDHAANPGHGLVAILAAVHARKISGKGAYIELAQVHSTLQLLGPSIMAAADSGTNPSAMGNRVAGAIFAGAVRAADRYFVATIRTRRQAEALISLLRNEGFYPEAEPSITDDGVGGQSLTGTAEKALFEWAATQGCRVCVAKLQQQRIPSAPVEDSASLCTEYPELWDAGHLVRLPHPEMGDAVYNAPPIRRTDRQEPNLRSAPLLGEHSAQVMSEWLQDLDMRPDA